MESNCARPLTPTPTAPAPSAPSPGALHDSCRAVLAGSRTYGKGLIQSVYELSDGSGLVITVGKYLTPNGTQIDRCAAACMRVCGCSKEGDVVAQAHGTQAP